MEVIQKLAEIADLLIDVKGLTKWDNERLTSIDFMIEELKKEFITNMGFSNPVKENHND